MTNPNPQLITEPMWKLWTDRPNPNWKLSGIYANKKGYHNTVNANLKNWPGHYSIKLPLDLVSFNRDKARAIDLTMSTTEMIKITTRMQVAAMTPGDTRLRAVKEFFGTLDGKTVFGLSKDSLDGTWRKVSANLSHLWHLHAGFFTAFVDDWFMLAPVLSVWKGENYAQWKGREMNLPESGDKGESVRFWQYLHNLTRTTVSPPSPEIKIDGDYGSATAAAFYDFWKKCGGSGTTYKGGFVTAWLATKYLAAFARLSVPVPTPKDPSPELIKEAVADWLDTNVANKLLKIRGTLEGTVDPQ